MGRGRETGREGEQGCLPQLGSLETAVDEGREGEKGEEESLDWGGQTLLFSTSSIGSNAFRTQRRVHSITVVYQCN